MPAKKTTKKSKEVFRVEAQGDVLYIDASFVVRDEHDRVLCCHGRPIACLECGEEYAAELTGDEAPPDAVLSRGPDSERSTVGGLREKSVSSSVDVSSASPVRADPPLAGFTKQDWLLIGSVLSDSAQESDALAAKAETPADRLDYEHDAKTIHELSRKAWIIGMDYDKLPVVRAEPPADISRLEMGWFNMICHALGLFDGARPVPIEDVLRSEVLPTIEALKQQDTPNAMLVRELERTQALWREAIERQIKVGRAEPRLKANRFDCTTCGQGIGVDEDGCCRTCGVEAIVVKDGNSNPVRAEPPAPQPWQPIETAPKSDRTPILLWWPEASTRAVVGCWCPRGGGHWYSDISDCEGSGDPTHWLPLPDPPVAASQAVPPVPQDEPAPATINTAQKGQ